MRSCWRRAARPEQSIAVSRSDLGSSSFVLAGVLDAGRSGSWAGVRRPRGSIDSRREPRICGRGGTATADPVSCSVRPSPRERRDRCSGQAPHILPSPPLLATLPSPSFPPPCQTLPPPKLSWEVSPPLPRGGQGRGEPLCATAPWGMPYWPLGWQLLAPLRRAAARPLTVGAPTQIHSFRHQATAIKASARDRVHEENQPTGRTERVARPPTDGKLRTRTPRRSRHGQAVLPPPPAAATRRLRWGPRRQRIRGPPLVGRILSTSSAPHSDSPHPQRGYHSDSPLSASAARPSICGSSSQGAQRDIAFLATDAGRPQTQIFNRQKDP